MSKSRPRPSFHLQVQRIIASAKAYKKAPRQHDQHMYTFRHWFCCMECEPFYLWHSEQERMIRELRRQENKG